MVLTIISENKYMKKKKNLICISLQFQNWTIETKKKKERILFHERIRCDNKNIQIPFHTIITSFNTEIYR